MRVLIVACLMLLAGCSEGPAGGAPGTPSAETGSLRGVVVDGAVAAIAGVDVQVLGGPNATTDPDGGFRFDGLSPGSYQLLASKDGFFSVRATARVEAGEAQPDVVKMVLEHDPGAARYVEAQVFEGFVQQALTAAGARYSSNDAPDQEFDRVPAFFQVEMVWESTQSLGDAMDLSLLVFQPNATTGSNFVRAIGTSPLHIGLTGDDLRNESIPPGRMPIAIFSAANDPVPLGVTLEQPFTLFLHRFHGFTPPEGWTFTADGPIAPP